MSPGGTVLTVVLLTQMHFSTVIPQHVTVQVMWKVPVGVLTFKLPQQTEITIITSQGAFTKCSSFQSSHLIVTQSSSG